MKKYFEVTAFIGTKLEATYKFTFSESRLIGQVAKEFDWIKVEVKEVSEESYKLIFDL